MGLSDYCVVDPASDPKAAVVPKYTNSFRTPVHTDEEILDADGNKLGEIRLKPSSVLWKPKGAHKYFSVDLDSFTSWITDPSTNATRTSK